MNSVVILEHETPVAFVDTDPDRTLDPSALMTELQKVADLINVTTWTTQQRDAFRSMKKIVFFLGSVDVGAYRLTRPGCDEANAIFYWEVGEFLANADPGVRANILFHDCWHAVQHQADGFAKDEAERVAREVEALHRQIEAAEALNCAAAVIRFLRAFAADQQAIRDRLAFGVSPVNDA